jgi:DNA adenine methylase
VRRYFEPFLGGGAVMLRLLGCDPFLRWAGGKRRIADQIITRMHRAGCPLPQDPNLELKCTCLDFKSYHGSDAAADLVAAWLFVQRDSTTAGRQLLSQAWAPSAERYAQVRQWQPHLLGLRGLRTLWLNLYSFNGLFRHNRRGEFNAPPDPARFATVDRAAVAAQWAEVARQIARVHLSVSGAVSQLRQCGPDDVAYLDPPYWVDGTSRFTGYSGEKFDVEEQHELAAEAAAAIRRGCRVVASNSPAASATWEEALRGLPHAIEIIQSRRSISCKGDGRGMREEILIVADRNGVR